jgi:hypothetical protein
MENETSKTRQLKIAFLLDPESLRNLQTLLSEIEGTLEYKVKFSDGSTVKYFDMEEIIAQPNAGNKFIVALIASGEGLLGRSVFLTMRGDPEPSVEYTLTGVQRDVGYFSDKLDDWIASCTRQYSMFYSSSLGVVLAFCIVALPFFLAGRVTKAFPISTTHWQPYGSLATLVAVGAIEYWTLKLFPRATFAVGYGAKREQLFSGFRVSVLLAIAVGLGTEWLVRLL